MRRKCQRKAVIVLGIVVSSVVFSSCSSSGTVDTGVRLEGTSEVNETIWGLETSGEVIGETEESTVCLESTEELLNINPTELQLPEGTQIGEYFSDGGQGNSAGWYIETDRSEWVNKYPQVKNIPVIYQADGWLEIHEQSEVLLNGAGIPYIPVNHVEMVEYEQFTPQLWLTQVEVELYTNTEVMEYNISEEDNIVHYWCVVYSGEQVSFLFLRQTDFSEDEIKEVIRASYTVSR